MNDFSKNFSVNYPKKIVLNKSGSAFIIIDYLPQYLCEINNEKFNNIWNLHPLQNHIVINNEKEIKVNRYSQSYLQTPKIDREEIKFYSYMYSGFNYINHDLHNEFKPYYNFINKIDENYNKVAVNWFENGEDNISFHSDCNDNMIENAKILIISLYNYNEITNEYLRTFIIKPKPNVKSLKKVFEIKLEHGMILTMCGNIQDEFRHGIKKDFNVKLPRISISFRQMNNIEENK